MTDLSNNIRAVLNELTNGHEPEIWQHLLTLYLNDTPAAIAQIQQAQQHHDISQLSVLVHSLKSSSATLGITPVTTVCQTIEQVSPDLAQISQQIQQLLKIYPDVVHSLTTLLQNS
jgi:HPt (histidine-containing phosphotransfer) domain-containing protein